MPVPDDCPACGGHNRERDSRRGRRDRDPRERGATRPRGGHHNPPFRLAVSRITRRTRTPRPVRPARDRVALRELGRAVRSTGSAIDATARNRAPLRLGDRQQRTGSRHPEDARKMPPRDNGRGRDRDCRNHHPLADPSTGAPSGAATTSPQMPSRCSGPSSAAAPVTVPPGGSRC